MLSERHLCIQRRYILSIRLQYAVLCWQQQLPCTWASRPQVQMNRNISYGCRGLRPSWGILRCVPDHERRKNRHCRVSLGRVYRFASTASSINKKEENRRARVRNRHYTARKLYKRSETSGARHISGVNSPADSVAKITHNKLLDELC